MARRNTPIEHAKDAAKHHTTLTLLDRAAEVLNSSDMHHSTHALAERLTRAIRKEQQRQLKFFDAALARIGGVPASDPDCFIGGAAGEATYGAALDEKDQPK